MQTSILTSASAQPGVSQISNGNKHNAARFAGSQTPLAKVGVRETLMAVAIVATQFAQVIPFGTGVNSATAIAKDLGVSQVNSSWLAASYPLTQGAFVVAGGRLGAIYGHRNLALVAGTIWVVFTLVSGFMENLIALCIMRAFSGIGGKLRNMTVSFYGAMAPIGAASGGLWPGVFVQLTPWKWLFFFMAMLGAVIFALFAVVVPGEGKPMDEGGSFDLVGAYLSVGGLILFNFVWNQAPVVGWNEPYEYVLLIVAVLHLVSFLVWEAKVADSPIIPFGIWTAPSFLAMILSALLTFMAVGELVWYVTIWNQNIKSYSIALNGAAFLPLLVGGAMAAVASGKLVSRIAAQYIMATGSIATMVASILVATQAERQSYWAQTFPALLVLACGPDFIFTAAQIIASNSVSRQHQGVAGSLIGTISMYGLSLGLGFASTVEAYTNKGGDDLVKGYRNALYLAVGFAGMSMLLAVLWVRIPKDVREGWDEDMVLTIP